MDIIAQIRNLVENECKKSSNPFGYDGSWKYHILQVLKFAKILAEKWGAEQEIVEIASLLHDLTSIKGDYEEHHISGAKEAEKILKELGYPQDKIERVKHCIFAHRASQRIKRETIEAECVACADVIAHFRAIPSLFRFCFVQCKMSIDEAIKWVRDKLDRDWDKLPPTVKEMIKEEYEASRVILGSFDTL